MSKLIFANLVVAVLLPASAFATDSVCSGYNKYVSKQCVASAELKGDLSDEMLVGYSVASCRDESFKMILETDESASASCKPVMKGKLVSALK